MSLEHILLGEEANGKPVRIDPKTRSTHLHVIGSSGEGKSKFLEHLIRQDIINNNGLCLIDPHGYLYNDLVRWAETKGMLDRTRPKKIILFDPGAENWTFGFNPLSTGGKDISYHVDAMVNTVAKAWGDEDQTKTPRLRKILRLIFHTLIEKKLSLYEAIHLTNAMDGELREFLTSNLKDGLIRQQWAYINHLKPVQFDDQVGSAINRLMEFLASTLVRATLGQLENTIDFRQIMDEGWMLLVNLAAKDPLGDSDAKLLGRLIVNDLRMKAMNRPKGSRPFYLYIDECARYVNEDTARILDECRKFGLHLTLAHQHLAQLKKAGEDVYSAVMTDAKTKVIFGGLSTEDARVLAEQVFLGELDLEETKKTITKPVVVGYVRTWLNSYAKSQSHGGGEMSGSSESGGQSAGQSAGVVMTPDGLFLSPNALSQNQAEFSGSSQSWGKFSGSSSSWSESTSQGQHEALEPILEKRADQVFNLEEQIYKAMAVMVNQPTQHAIIKLPKKHTKLVKTPTVEPGYARDSRVAEFKERCFTIADFALPRDQAVAMIKTRQRALMQAAKEAQVALAAEPEDFKEPAFVSTSEAPAGKPAEEVEKVETKTVLDVENFWEDDN
jgi:hypothetical protein